MAAPLVPWITGWSAEDRYEVRPCRYAGGRLALWQPHAPGTGEPLFKSRHAVRGRRAVVESLCTVCGQPVKPAERWLFPRGKRVHQPDGSTLCTLNEPPLHEACAEQSLALCPHIRAEGWQPVAYPGALGTVDVIERGAALNASLGTHAHPDAEVVVGTCYVVPNDVFARWSVAVE